jgi:hypothetical protein
VWACSQISKSTSCHGDEGSGSLARWLYELLAKSRRALERSPPCHPLLPIKVEVGSNQPKFNLRYLTAHTGCSTPTPSSIVCWLQATVPLAIMSFKTMSTCCRLRSRHLCFVPWDEQHYDLCALDSRSGKLVVTWPQHHHTQHQRSTAPVLVLASQ